MSAYNKGLILFYRVEMRSRLAMIHMANKEFAYIFNEEEYVRICFIFQQ